ncbi:hypothetical protein ARALYDRAFT_917040 [Arabidopsis lyrata subsp. lyrata]|uniref:Uncharacterized protein n=1 Tax=Arabidopsis lyrata subsp. lyrata TaxID=81972 RepID=D7MKX6_ARALL|nr:protein MARD1 [Arabidopsis lyrata subsp. lyrata]EFH41551.1 hypothetical protein ARALYDRAFT_917040 [Arabidopsis lyrata subsp. lyrata]|eukprot:XP_002865292.1 protein MARD1 [Arabidopsis lyrata subsp. lyrata]
MMTYFDSDFSLVSPTSILEANPSIFSSKYPKPVSYFEPSISNPQRFHTPDVFGLADLVIYGDSNRDHSRNLSTYKMVLFGSKLRVQIPSDDFGTKTGMRYSILGVFNLIVGEVGELLEIFQWKGEVARGCPDWKEEEKVHLGKK